MARYDLEGKTVSEEEVAANLGFANVAEMRRWQTECGQKVVEIERKLSAAISDRDHFKWHGQRMLKVLALLRPALESLRSGGIIEPSLLNKFILAIEVASGTGADWHNELVDWL